MERILKAGDSWVLLDYTGFKPTILPSWLTEADAEAPAEFEPTPDPISTPDERDVKVYWSNGAYHFDEDGTHYRYRNGQWEKQSCNGNSCQWVTAA